MQSRSTITQFGEKGGSAARRADARLGAIYLTFIHVDLAAAIARAGCITRLSAFEQGFMV